MGAWLLSLLLPGPLTSLEVFLPKEKTNDVDFSDFYAMMAYENEVVPLDRNVTIIATDGCSRAEIGRAIAFADSAGAAVIGIDLILSEPTTVLVDSIIEAIDTARNVVLPVVLSNPDEKGRFQAAEVAYFDSWLEQPHEYAAVNINGGSRLNTTRFFKGELELSNGETMPTFSALIAEKYSPGSFQKLLNRRNNMELINFSGREFTILSPEEMTKVPELITGHIILIGCVENLSDIHRVPLTTSMPGIVIHAHTIANIIDGDYIDYSGRMVNWLVAFTACFAILFLRVYYTDMKKKWVGLVVRILQVVLIVLALNIGSYIYINGHYSIDFAPTVTLSLLGLVAMDVITGIWDLTSKRLTPRVKIIFSK
ncbi:MAG: CHASE2 domain-containing protein [Bacteroides sp.]|nr:CHASE2 domain-containing protein [Bacteroides sp.]MCM1471535.1 CHASE2 domain-containing protein [Bacteroides sp.]